MKIKYTESNREELFEDLLLRHYSLEGKPNELAEFRSFFETGNIEKFLEKGGSAIDPNTIFFVGANPTLENLKYRLRYFWCDLVDYPEKYENSIHIPNNLSRDELFYKWVKSFVSSFDSYFIPTNVYSEVFTWIFGETFKEVVVFPMSFGSDEWVPEFNCDPNWLMCTLLGGVIENFFKTTSEYIIDPQRYLPLQDYLISSAPFIDKELYSTKRFSLRHRHENGEYSSYRARQSVIRRYFALTNGILSQSTIDEEGLTELVTMNEKQLYLFKGKFEAALPFPELLPRILNLIKESGPGYARVSE